MENKSHALAAGTFVVLLLALVIALAVWLTRDTRDLQTYELSSPDAVTGLQPQASVRYKGVNIGKVTAISLDPQKIGNVLIEVAIDGQAPITESTFGTLGFQGVTGLAFVQLDDKGESTVMLPRGGTPPARIPMRPSLLTKLTDQGEDLLAKLVTGTERVNTLLSDDNQKALRSALDNMSQAAAGLQQLTVSTNKALPQFLQESRTTLQVIQTTSDRVGDSADEAKRSAASFKQTTERMNAKDGTLDQLARGVETLAVTGQTLNAASLPRLNRAVDDTARAARQVSRAVNAVNDNPQSLIFGHGPIAPGPGEAGFIAPNAKANTP
ncbi:MAG: MCE family protein [Rhodoferax sp.]|nr:MCE family protein [Rhodoferax sp.]MBP7491372.1 MCE family protein [Rhodoferax sp.]